MKKLLFSIGLSLCLLAGCQQAPTDYILNDFDSIQELYSIRPAIQLMDGRMDIAGTDSGMVRSGSGCAQLTYESGSSPYLLLHLGQTAYPELELAGIAQMNLWIFNDNTQATSCELTLVGTDFSPLLTQEYTLAPGQWNDLVLPMSSDSYPAEQVLGFGLRLNVDTPSRFYLDRWSLTPNP